MNFLPAVRPGTLEIEQARGMIGVVDHILVK
jgi:hypothetical protein